MNENPESDSDTSTLPESGPPIASRKPRRTCNDWCRILFACNPFFLCSAGLLLLGINRLSTDDRLFASDLHNLIFNFFSLQGYEGIVIVTALMLARRKIFYDSALLVVLDSVLALVPFMLISQATMEGTSIAWILCAAGGALAALRFGGIRKWYSQFNLPARALALGACILTANVVLPLVFLPTIEPDHQNWIRPNDLIWAFALPLLAAGANLLPRPFHDPHNTPGRPWLPLLLYALWTAGTGVHAWCLAHISSVPLQLHHLAPVLCIAAWTFLLRLTDCAQTPPDGCRIALLITISAIPLLAYGHDEAFVLLGAINLPAFLALLVSKQSGTAIRVMAKHLAMVTAGLMFVAFPADWMEILSPVFNPGRFALIGAAAYLVVFSAASHKPELSIPGALGAGTMCGLLWATTSHQPVQVAFAYLVLHSLRWNDARHSTAHYMRIIAIVAWILESFMRASPLSPFDRDATIGAVVVFIAWGIARQAGHQRTHWIPGGATGVILASPLQRGIQIGSTGLLALVASLLLFAIGTWVAWNRPRWTMRNDR